MILITLISPACGKTIIIRGDNGREFGRQFIRSEMTIAEAGLFVLNRSTERVYSMNPYKYFKITRITDDGCEIELQYLT